MKLDRARQLSEDLQGKRVAVIGDLMLDRYVWGKASRISQEAPVPIVSVSKTNCAPGGSANVLRNLACLGAKPVAFGVVGNDESGRELCALLGDMGVDLTGIVCDKERRTTEKSRIVAGGQQIVRVDYEDLDGLESAHADELVTLLSNVAKHGKLDGIIIEDYAKGTVIREVVEKVVALGQKLELPVACDPHPASAFNVKGLTVLTPNRAEAFALAGCYPTEGVLPLENDKSLIEVVARLDEAWGAEQLLITLGGQGMALFTTGNSPLHIPTQAREVFDVSGAGDTVVASYVLGLLAGATPEEAAVISNHAAGVVVGKIGTATVSTNELLESFENQSD